MKNQMKKNGQKKKINGGEKTTAQRRKNKRLETKKGQHKQWSKSGKTKSTQTPKRAQKDN